VIAVLCGGVGAARYLRGLVRVVDPTGVAAVVNTADDLTLHGLRVCPDLDTVTYTLGDGIDPERGWGLTGETWAAMEALDRYGGATWFRLGDRDLATHLYRTGRLHEGAGLAEVTAEVAAAWGVGVRLLPMTEDPVATRFSLPGGEEISFQEYFVQRRHEVPVTAVRFAGVELARPGPGVLDALGSAERVVVAPSNPVVSIGPVVAVPGVRERLEARRDAVVAVSPIIAGAALKGPADRLLDELGEEASVVGMARRYAPFVGTLVVDEADADRADAVEAEGVRCVVAPTIMSGRAESAALATVTLTC
jgi:LPPG:FO 2-phospho-L-lactate transferase